MRLLEITDQNQNYSSCMMFSWFINRVSIFLKQLGIKYSKITKDEFVTLIDILRKCDIPKFPGSKRGKGSRKKQ
jgi:hypothetical protein